MKIVILGYNGLIGNSILDHLNKIKSFSVICVARNIKYKPYINSRTKYYKWNFTSFKKSNLLFLKKADIVINCVGKIDEGKKNLRFINFIFIKKFLDYLKSHREKLRIIHLSSISVYGGHSSFLGKKKIINENSNILIDSIYSKYKFQADLLIKNMTYKRYNKNLTFTILRISNVFGGKKKSNLFRLIFFLINLKLWIKSFDDVMFNFVSVKDVAQAVVLSISKLKISKNKIYIISDDVKQKNLYKNYLGRKKFFIIKIPINLVKFVINSMPLPKKILNFLLNISSRVTYDNQKIIDELSFTPSYSIHKKKFI